MARKPLIRVTDFPYHLTNRSNNREFFYTPPERLWPIFLKVLKELKFQFKCEIHAFVLMSNHYHLLLSTPEANLGPAMRYLHREVARHVNRDAGRMNHVFGGRYKWSVITDENYYWNAVKYIFANPVRAGICEKVQDFPYSSLNSSADFGWRMVDYFAREPRPIELDLEWLNQNFEAEKEEAIRKALRRREFALPQNKLRKPIALDAAKYKKGTGTLNDLE